MPRHHIVSRLTPPALAVWIATPLWFAIMGGFAPSASAQDVERPPTAAEQLMVEILNRTRRDPMARRAGRTSTSTRASPRAR